MECQKIKNNSKSCYGEPNSCCLNKNFLDLPSIAMVMYTVTVRSRIFRYILLRGYYTLLLLHFHFQLAILSPCPPRINQIQNLIENMHYWEQGDSDFSTHSPTILFIEATVSSSQIDTLSFSCNYL